MSKNILTTEYTESTEKGKNLSEVPLVFSVSPVFSVVITIS